MDATKEQHVEVDIQVQCVAKALDQHDRSRVGLSFCIASFVDQVRGKGAIDNAQDFTHDFGLAGKQEPEREKAHWE